MARIRLALVGFGKIARDQHVPALAADPDFEFTAIASPGIEASAVPRFADLDALLCEGPRLDAIAICTPPQARFELARRALEQGLHVLLEKPPAMSVCEVERLAELARKEKLALFASWHSRHAPAVESARSWLEGRRIAHVSITWKEDVRVWHPGQHWIWLEGGLGVFDPGINALSILTCIIPERLTVNHAELSVPGNCAMPIAASLHLASSGGIPIDVAFDFRETGLQTWTIEFETDRGRLVLSDGGAKMDVDGRATDVAPKAEYRDVYAHFARLVRGHQVDVDSSPLRLVEEAFACARRIPVEAFSY